MLTFVLLGMGNRFETFTQYHTIVKAHAIMAALIFLLIIPVSIMIVRFYDRRPGYAIIYHGQLQVLASLMLLVVFILGFFAVGPERALSNPHHGIGVAIFVLFLLQLIGGRLVRNITKSRSLRIMIHQWSGRTIGLLGIVQIPLGLTLYGSPKYLFILYAVWMSFLVLVYFILSYRAAGRREFYMGGPRSEGGRTRLTDSEYLSDHKPGVLGKLKWLGPLAALGGLWALLRGRKKKHEDGDRSRSPSRSRREVLSSRRGSDSYYDDKYTDATQKKSGGGFMKYVAGAAAALGAGKLASNFMNKRNDRRDEEYSAVSTETPRRHRSGRDARSDFNSEYTDEYGRDQTETSLLPPSANPAATHTTRYGDESAYPSTPRRSHAAGRDFGDSEYSSYVSPSRRSPAKRSGGMAQGILGGLGMGWLAKKFADRRARKDEDRRLREEEDMRSGISGSRFTGDGYPSPTRQNSRRPAPVRRHTDYGTESQLTEITESSIEPPRPEDPYGGPPPPRGSGPVPPVHGGHSRSRSQSRRDIDPVAMPPMPADPHGVLHSGTEGSFVSSDGRPQRRNSSRRRRAGERAAAAAAARASSLAANEERSFRDDRDRYGSPSSQPLSVKVKMHDDRDRNVTLRRLTEEEAMAARGRRNSDSSLSGMDSPSNGRRYRRGSTQRAAEMAAEERSERDTLAPLSPPNPAYAKGRRGKDSAYYSGQPGQSGGGAGPGQTVSSLGSLASPESHGTWSAMSPSPGGPDKGSESAAADNRRRRRLERRRGSSSRPTGADMFD